MSLLYVWSKLIKKLRASAIKKSIIHKTSKVESGCSIVNVSFDRHSFCGYDCEIVNCEIGSFCSIANGVIIGGGMHPMNWVSTSPVFYEGRDSVKAKFSTHSRTNPEKTLIGHDVWIGRNVIIKQGVKIGTGAVIGMGAIVTKDVEPYSIVAGNPAKIVRYRFDQLTIEKLLTSEWWLFDDEKLKLGAKYFTDPAKFLEMLEP